MTYAEILLQKLIVKSINFMPEIRIKFMQGTLCNGNWYWAASIYNWKFSKVFYILWQERSTKVFDAKKFVKWLHLELLNYLSWNVFILLLIHLDWSAIIINLYAIFYVLVKYIHAAFLQMIIILVFWYIISFMD